jgi:hypothetical protein
MRRRKEMTASCPAVGAAGKRLDMYLNKIILTNLYASFNGNREIYEFYGIDRMEEGE